MFRRRRSADDFADEIKAHLELEADELEREGVSEEEARRRASAEFGSVSNQPVGICIRKRLQQRRILCESGGSPPCGVAGNKNRCFSCCQTPMR